MRYPSTPIKPIEENLHGTKIVDSYRWLEDDNSAEVRKWTKAQNKLVADTLEKTDQHRAYREQLEKLLAIDTQSTPSVRRGRYFYTQQMANQDHSVLCYQDGLKGKPITILDPNKITKQSGKSTSLHFYGTSPSGRYVSYGLMVEGHEMSTLTILDLQNNHELISLPFHRSPAVWLPDETGFYHSQYPDPQAVPKGEDFYHIKLNFYSLAGKKDRVVFGEGFHKETSFGCSVSPDGNQIIVSSTRGWRSNELYVGDTKSHTFKPLVKGLDATFGVAQLADCIIVSTNYKAPSKRLLMVPYDELDKDIEEWQEIVPESEDAISNWGITSEYLIISYLHNVTSQVKVFNHAGKFIAELDIPPLSSLNSLNTNIHEAEFFYSYSNFLTSNAIYYFNPSTQTSEQFKEPQRSLDGNVYEAKQEWCNSKDGTRVPMFIIKKKSVTPSVSNKVVLWGYGGFKNSETPSFLTGWIPFIEKGGTFVIANIRGGGEFGRLWHENGLKEKRQNVFDDFTAVAEYLIQSSYTSAPHLAIMGGSNGGLLVAVSMLQRPDLFGAVVCKVPLIDMVRFPKFLMASRWTEEYGDPGIKTELKSILKWSPYHNIKAGTTYPPILITTGNHDNRVAPLHARKFAAALQALHGPNPVYLYTDTAMGHGPGQGRKRAAYNAAITLTFLDAVI